MFSIIYWIAGLNPEAERFFIALGIVILILQVSEKLGLYKKWCARTSVYL